MKKILLLSDTHGYIDDDIIKYVHKADEVWHAGDIGNLIVTDTIKKFKPLRAVYGNIDNEKTRLQFPKNNFFQVESVKIFMTHIGGYPGRYAKGISNLLQQYKPHLFVDGHSHILKVMFDKKNNLLYMNPGAVGKSGFHKVRTMLFFEIEKKEIKNLKVIEWQKS